MPCLLDTHTLLWFVDEAPQLPLNVRELIEGSKDVCVSIASFWEMAIKSSKGKLSLTCSIIQMMGICIDTLKFPILHIKGVHLEMLRTLPWIHKDPFDRLLIAQAMSEEMALVTADEHIAKYPVHRMWAV